MAYIYLSVCPVGTMSPVAATGDVAPVDSVAVEGYPGLAIPPANLTSVGDFCGVAFLPPDPNQSRLL